MNTSKSYLHASAKPEIAIASVSYAGQDPNRKLYRSGYESYMDALPLLVAQDDLLEAKLTLSSSVMKSLAKELINEHGWATEVNVFDGDFKRTIVAIEDPIINIADEHLSVKEGKELVVAKWGNGFSSPIHGHSAGFLHEELLSGKMIVNLYKQVYENSDTVRLVRSDIYQDSVTIASQFSEVAPTSIFKRQALIHNFTSVGFSSSLHYVPEHTRDGRDNGFKVEYFEDFSSLNEDDVKQIDAFKGIYLPIGEVALVRSLNVPDYGDHFIIVTGRPIAKPHGLRPQEVGLIAPHAGCLLDGFDAANGLTLLQLKPEARDAFHRFHGISIVNGEVILPKA